MEKDPIKKLTTAEFAAKIKEKYPSYKDIDDDELVSKILDKYPEYSDKVDLGLKKKSEPLSGESSEDIYKDNFDVTPDLPEESTQEDDPSYEETIEPVVEASQEVAEEPSEKNGILKDLWLSLKSGTQETLAGIAGIPNLINKTAVSMVLSKEELAELNKLPPEVRETIISRSGSALGGTQSALMELSSDWQDYATEKSDEIAAKMTQYEGNIVDDIAQGRGGQAFRRVLTGAVQSLPSMAVAFIPAVGLGVVGAGAGAQKQERLEQEGKGIGAGTVANAIVSGVAEGFFEKYTVNMFKPFGKMFKGNRELAATTAKEVFTHLAKSLGVEGGSEALTELTNELADSLFTGEEFNFAQTMKNVADAGLIGAFVGGGAVTTAVKDYSVFRSMSTEEKVKYNESAAKVRELESSKTKENKRVVDRSIQNTWNEFDDFKNKRWNKIEGMEYNDVENIVEISKDVDAIDNTLKEGGLSIETIDDLQSQKKSLEEKKSALIEGKKERLSTMESFLADKYGENFTDEQLTPDEFNAYEKLRLERGGVGTEIGVKTSKESLSESVLKEIDNEMSMIDNYTEEEKAEYSSSVSYNEELKKMSPTEKIERQISVFKNALSYDTRALKREEAKDIKDEGQIQYIKDAIKENNDNLSRYEQALSELKAETETKLDSETRTDKKGRTVTYFENKKSKDGVTTTTYTFNRSNKDSSQRNKAGVKPEVAFKDLQPTEDSIPEDAKITKVFEVRVGEDGRAGATVQFINADGDTFRGEVQLVESKPETNVIENEKTVEDQQKTEPVDVPTERTGTMLNVGLVKGKSKEAITEDQVKELLPDDVEVIKTARVEKESGLVEEPTMSLELSRPLTDEEIFTLRKGTDQLAIPQYSEGKGVMYGTKDWGDFNGEYFVTTEGNRLVEPADTGQQNEEFFTGKAAEASSDIKYEPVIKVKETPTTKAYDVYSAGGNFTGHISKMIAGFQEKQKKVAEAIVKGGFKNFLDIGTSEGGMIKTVASQDKSITAVGVDPNSQMKKNFESTPEVPNAEFKQEAYQGSWTEADGTEIKEFKPKEKFDVVNEDFTFQFVNNDRAKQVKGVKEMMTPDGLFITSEKFHTANSKENEAKKVKHQEKYFTPEERTTDKEEIIVGMSKDMVNDVDYFNTLKDNFKFVEEFWNAGDFKGYIASDNQQVLRDFKNNVGDLTTEFTDTKSKTLEQDTKTTPFENSKVQEPVYHGGSVFDNFKSPKEGDKGIYFSDNYDLALYFANQQEISERDKRNEWDDIPEDVLEATEDGELIPEKYLKYSEVKKSYIDLQNPVEVESGEAKLITQNYKEGSDGVIMKNTVDFGYGGTQYVVFNDNQIKTISKNSEQDTKTTPKQQGQTTPKQEEGKGKKEEVKLTREEGNKLLKDIFFQGNLSNRVFVNRARKIGLDIPLASEISSGTSFGTFLSDSIGEYTGMDYNESMQEELIKWAEEVGVREKTQIKKEEVKTTKDESKKQTGKTEDVVGKKGKEVKKEPKTKAKDVGRRKDSDKGDKRTPKKPEKSELTPVQAEINRLKEGISKEAEVIRGQGKRVLDALSKIAPDVKVKTSTTTKEFKQRAGTDVAASGMYDPNTKTLHINLELADEITVAHEAFHALLVEHIINKVGGKKAQKAIAGITKDFVASLSRVLPKDSKGRSDLEFITAQALDAYSEGAVNEEILAQLTGYLANNYTNLEVSTKTKVKDFLNKIAKALGLMPIFSQTSKDVEVVNFLNNISNKFAVGSEIVSGDMVSVSGNIKAQNIDALEDYEISPRMSKFLEEMKVQDIPTHENSKVVEGFDLRKINGQKASSTLSDKLMTGVIDGHKLLGGLNYPVVTGRVWASGKLQSSNKIVNESKKSKDGYRYLIPAIMSPVSHMSNKDMTHVAFSLLREANANGEMNMIKFIGDIQRAFSNKTLANTERVRKLHLKNISDKLNGLTTIDEAIKVVEEYTLGKNVSFESRKSVLKSLIGDSAKGNPKYKTVGTFTQLAKTLSEERAADLNLHQVNQVIRTKGDLSVVKTDESDPLHHRSYPYTIVSDAEVEVLRLSNVYDLTDIIPEFTTSTGKKYSTANELDKVTNPKYRDKAIKNLGRTHGLSSYSSDINARYSLFQGVPTDKKIEILETYDKKSSLLFPHVAMMETAKETGVKLYEAIAVVSMADPTVLDTRPPVNALVKEMMAMGYSHADIIDAFPSKNSQMFAQDYITRNTDFDPKNDYNRIEEQFEKARKKVYEDPSDVSKITRWWRNAAKQVWDKRFMPKKIIKAAGGKLVRNYMIAENGANGMAKKLYDDAQELIYGGVTLNPLNKKQVKALSEEDIKTLDKIIQMRRFMAIDKSRKEAGLPEVTHPDFINNKRAESWLQEKESEIGTEKFNELNKRADKYFNTYRDVLKRLTEAGLVSQEAFDEMIGIDYQPRLFLKWMEDVEGELSIVESNQGGFGKDATVKGLKHGSDEALLSDSRYLLSRSLNIMAKGIAKSKTTGKLVEFMEKQDRKVQEMKKKGKLTNKEKNTVKYFQELQKNVRYNPIVGYNNNGDPKYKYSPERGEVSVPFYRGGTKHQVLMNKKFADEYNGEVSRIFSNNETREKFTMASLTGLVKGLATGNNPTFFLVNTPRDIMFISTFSEEYGGFLPANMFKVIKDGVKGARQAASQDATYSKFVEYGGMMDFLNQQGKFKGTNKMNEWLDKNIGRKSGLVGKSIFNEVTLSQLQMLSEMGLRLGVFNRSISNQLKALNMKTMEEVETKMGKETVDDIYTNAVASARMTTDFNQGGAFVKDADAVVPYLNASVQGTRAMVEAFQDRPTQTTLRVMQTASILSSIPIAMSMMLLGSDSEDKDETYDKLVEAYSGVSMYDKTNYMIIFTGNKDEDGEYEYIRIAKPHGITPFTTLMDHIFFSALEDKTGKSTSNSSFAESMRFSIENNVSPVDFTLMGNISRTPTIKAAMTYTTGYDFFRNQDLSYLKGRKNVAVEGHEQKGVPDFYKKIGKEYDLSPARMKGAVESLITTPSTSPWVGIAYSLADILIADKDMGSPIQAIGEIVSKSAGARLKKTTSKWNRQTDYNKKYSKETSAVQIERVEMDKLARDVAKELKAKIETGTLDSTELNEAVAKVLEQSDSPFDKKRMFNMVKDRIRKPKESAIVTQLRYQESKVRALILATDLFGDSLFDNDNAEMVGQLKKAGILNKETIYEYKKLINKD